VGMDIVKTTMDRLKGKVTGRERNQGAAPTFQLVVPLTLASIQALMFRVDNQHYAVSLDSVLEISRTSDSEIHEIDGTRFFDCATRFERRAAGSIDCEWGACGGAKTRHFVVTIERAAGGSADRRWLDRREELVIKAFEDRLVASDLVSGASILGDGTVVLILNVLSVFLNLTKSVF